MSQDPTTGFTLPIMQLSKMQPTMVFSFFCLLHIHISNTDFQLSDNCWVFLYPQKEFNNSFHELVRPAS